MYVGSSPYQGRSLTVTPQPLTSIGMGAFGSMPSALLRITAEAPSAADTTLRSRDGHARKGLYAETQNSNGSEKPYPAASSSSVCCKIAFLFIEPWRRRVRQ